MQDLFTQALGINSPWFIKDVEFNNKQLNIHIDFKKVASLSKIVKTQKPIAPTIPSLKPTAI